MEQLTYSSVIDELNFGTLRSEDEYAKYFTQLNGIFGLVHQSYQKLAEGGCDESELVAHFFTRLLYTVQILRMKYSYRSTESRPLWVDLSESGFPNFAEIEALQSDFERKVARVADLPSPDVLKRSLLKQLIEKQTDSEELLAQLSERTYLDMLDPQRMMFFFTPGTIISLGTKGAVRQYLYTWSCYDFATNRPYIHLLAFDQDASRPPIDQPSEDREAFLSVLRGEGSRAPNVGVLAMAIDTALDHIYPKILRRLCVGPLYSRLLLDGRPENPEDKRETVLRHVLLGPNGRKDDFILFLTDELVISERQETINSLFAPWPRIRQIFAIPTVDPDCYERGASIVNHYVLLPHRLLQQISPEWHSAIPDFAESKKWTFDARGEIHGI